MSEKTTRQGIYLTKQQWAAAKAAGDGNYSAGVRRRLDEWAALIDANGEQQEEIVNLEIRLESLAAAPTYRVRGRWFVFGWLAGFVVFALTLAVLEGADKGWWGGTL